jgi:uncharacterized membrane protein YuzA (DUF378 family)
VVPRLVNIIFNISEVQYVINPTSIGVSQYDLQTAGNVFAISALIAEALYGNIGIKGLSLILPNYLPASSPQALYGSIFVELLHAPPLSTHSGKILWIGMIPI